MLRFFLIEADPCAVPPGERREPTPGEMNRPAALTRLAGSFWGSNRYQAINGAKNRLDAIRGMAGLCAGFALQAVGYVSSLATIHETRKGAQEALAAIGFGLLALLLTLIVGATVGRVRLLPLLVEMSRYTMDGQRLRPSRHARQGSDR